MTYNEIPRILCIAGHDPGGGAGIQADIEASAANGCLAATAITCLTVQDTCEIRRINPIPIDMIAAQIDAVLRDGPIAGIKIGLIGAHEIACYLSEFLKGQTPPTVVLDPILTSGRGDTLSNDALIDEIKYRLLPQIQLVTPNTIEARRLAGKEDIGACAKALSDLGCPNALITGAHEAGDQVINRLFRHGILLAEYYWDRIPGEFHGTGCTLAAAVAARMACGENLETAAEKAQSYTWAALANSRFTGRCQALPQRIAQPACTG